MIISNSELASRLNELESKVDLTSVRHDTFAHSTHGQVKQLFDAIRHLMEPPPTVTKQPVGFVVPEDKPVRPKGSYLVMITAGNNSEFYVGNFVHQPICIIYPA
jgi:hypothetical protein